MKASMRLVSVLMICVSMFVSGCAFMKNLIDFGMDTKEQIEQREAEKERLRKEEEEKKRQAELELQRQEELERQRQEEAIKQQYADGPNTDEHGRRGFLWKPVSDNTGTPVVLLPPRFSGKTRIVTANGNLLGRPSSVANGYREHYRMKDHYTGQVTIMAEASDGYNGAWYRWTWVIPDASGRHDSNVTPTRVKL